MKNLVPLILLITCFSVASCTFDADNQDKAMPQDSKEKAEKRDQKDSENKDREEKSETQVLPPEKEAENKTDCAKLKRDGMKLDQKQTFPIDFEPYQMSCFATFHEPDFDNPPLGEKFFIYKDGKEIFEFPDQNEAATYTIEAVSFQDLNGDDLKDVIVLGSVGVKSGTMYSSQVFVNTGEDFSTDREANFELDDFEKMKDVIDFVKKNKNIFIP